MTKEEFERKVSIALSERKQTEQHKQAVIMAIKKKQLQDSLSLSIDDYKELLQ